MQDQYQFTYNRNSALIFNYQKQVPFYNSLFKVENSVFIIDQRVFDLYFKETEISSPYLVLTSTEQNKSMKTLNQILMFLETHACHRTTFLTIIGGGILCDLGAFASSIFKRGILLRLVPTTLLAMVDASIGGKTGLNLKKNKNQIGSFYPADEILIHPAFNKTLDPIDLYNGKVEAAKTLLIMKEHEAFLRLINEKKIDTELIEKVASFKMQTCIQDLTDQAGRLLLNFGHTFGHIIESISAFKIPHGSAVAFGMDIAVAYSNYINLMGTRNSLQIRMMTQQLINLNPDYENHYLLLTSKSFLISLINGFFNVLNQDKKRNNFTQLVLMDNDYQLKVHSEKNNLRLYRFCDSYFRGLERMK